ncbi:MAG: AAC(3) family N-acetyltransferase [Candidatus Thermoplasmatota archaeon]|nr:AAC(3) family N-acetyltransferase [Candidatus Thermoplasmatota archaeon]
MKSVVDEGARRWTDSGIESGDLVMIHSSGKRTLSELRNDHKECAPRNIIESMLLAVGPNGTLLFPLFNFDFTKGVQFDIRNTPSHMGILTETARVYPGAVRTGHPIYSFAAIGHTAHLFRDVDNFSGYGIDSPFGMLRELDGKIAVLDLDDQNSMTFYHHIEEMNEVPYRFHKQFEGDYTDVHGKTDRRTYGLFVRRLDLGIITKVNPMGDLLWENGIYHGFRPGIGPGLRWAKARQVFDFVTDHIRNGKAKGLIYDSEKDLR